MLDLIADTVWRCVFQFTDKKRPVMGKLQDHRLWCDHPVSRFFPETVQKCDGICRNVRPGSGGKPAVMPDLIIVIPLKNSSRDGSSSSVCIAGAGITG